MTLQDYTTEELRAELKRRSDLAREEENTKVAIANSGSNLIEAYDREIKRLEEIERTLDNKFLYHPTKEFLATSL